MRILQNNDGIIYKPTNDQQKLVSPIIIKVVIIVIQYYAGVLFILIRLDDIWWYI